MTTATDTATEPTQRVTRVRAALVSRRQVIAGVLVLFGLVAIGVFGLQSKAGAIATFRWSSSGTFAAVPDMLVPARGVSIGLGIVVVLLGLALVAHDFGKQVTTWLLSIGLVLFFFAFLCWAAAGESMSLVDLGNSTLVRSIPIILGALAGILCERAGVINIMIEGQFLLGAFLGAVLASAFASLWLGVLGAVLIGAALGSVLAVLAIRYQVDQVIVGIVLNLFALGLTNFAFDRLLVPLQTKLNSPPIFGNIKVPLLGDIPIIGPIFFDANIFLYFCYVLLIVVDVALFRTRWGLRVRAVGEHPTAADTVGIRVNGTRYANVIMGGLVAGLGGAYFTIGSVGAFGKDMTSGEGYIALAAVIFGAWKPRGALLAALLFGFSDALQSILGILGTPIPSEFLLMAPYIATILAVAGLVGRVRAPGADGKPYVRA
jgi:simple sugar transport system permease protein